MRAIIRFRRRSAVLACPRTAMRCWIPGWLNSRGPNHPAHGATASGTTLVFLDAHVDRAPEHRTRHPRLGQRGRMRPAGFLTDWAFFFGGGLDPHGYAGHSLQAGLATSAAIPGASERAIVNQTGHRSSAVGRRFFKARLSTLACRTLRRRSGLPRPTTTSAASMALSCPAP
jgi:hypothetical protein